MKLEVNLFWTTKKGKKNNRIYKKRGLKFQNMMEEMSFRFYKIKRLEDIGQADVVSSEITGLTFFQIPQCLY